MLRINGGQSMPEHGILPSPSLGLNHVLGGGFWTGRFSLLWGTPSSGKTTMLLHMLAEAQKQGYYPVIVDSEYSVTDEWMDKCGLDKNRRIVLQSTITEEILKEIVPLFK